MPALPRLLVAAALALSFVGGPTSALAAQSMTPEDYKLYREYQSAMKDPRVLKMPESRRLPAIARNFRVPEARLKRVVALGTTEADALLETNEQAATESLSKTPVGPRVDQIDLVDQQGVVIAYVRWKAQAQDALPADAAWVAHTVATEAPLASMVAVWSCMGPTKVFTAKIRTSAAGRIRPERIEDFARTRYLRLFEDVHDAFAGSPPTDPTGCE